MKKYDIPTLVKLLAGPAAFIVLGLILLLNPDATSAFLGKLLAWAILLLGGCYTAGALFGGPTRRFGRGFLALLCIAMGIWFLRDPLVLVRNLGRILGLFLIGLGLQDIRLDIRLNGRVFFTPKLVVAVIAVAAGLVLFLLPMTTSRVVFTVCGIVLICVGAKEAYDRLKGRKRLGGSDGNIIDAL